MTVSLKKKEGNRRRDRQCDEQFLLIEEEGDGFSRPPVMFSASLFIHTFSFERKTRTAGLHMNFPRNGVSLSLFCSRQIFPSIKCDFFLKNEIHFIFISFFKFFFSFHKNEMIMLLVSFLRFPPFFCFYLSLSFLHRKKRK